MPLPPAPPGPLHASMAILAMVLIPFSCSGRADRDDAWEGISRATLRVHVRIDTSGEDGRNRHSGELREALHAAAGLRASLILNAHALKYAADSFRISSCREALPGIISNGRFIHRHCGESYCTAIVDYDGGPCIDESAPVNGDGAPSPESRIP